MATNVGLRQNDHNRVILTELIPYEIPIRFTFHHFYQLYSEGTSSPYIKRLFFSSAKWRGRDFIPFSYPIRRSGGKQRQLGLIHPLLFLPYVEFYRSYGELISSLCKKSGMSLRAPQRVAKTYVKSDGKEELDDDPDETDILHREFSTNYFANEKFNFLYKFYESRELVELETIFPRCYRTDVSNCFANIYTHSISWAINTKAISKAQAHKTSKQTFDAQFDLLARRSNHGETHGILVGGEVSRVFAEIIFQEIDVRLEEALAAQGLMRGKDYDIRRYIDDYFIFYVDDSHLHQITEKLGHLLASYKLFVNDSKSFEWRRPFVTSISIVKRHLSEIINDEVGFFSKGEKRGGNGLQSPLRFIRKIRLAIAEYEVLYSECSSYVLKEIFRRTASSMPDHILEEEHAEVYSRWLSGIVESIFFIFTVDVRFRASVLVSRVILCIQKAASFIPDRHAEGIRDLILSESIKFFHKVVQTGTGANVELASFLIALKGIAGSEKIASRLLEQIFFGENSPGRLDYFTIVSLLYFCESNPAYIQVRTQLELAAHEKIAATDDLIEDTEAFCLALDLLSCPYVILDLKRQITTRLLKAMEMSSSAPAVTQALADFSQKHWLFDWRPNVETEDYFRKKELSFSY